MPAIEVNGTRLRYRDTGAGSPVLLIAGNKAPGRTWHLHQVPALVAAGHRVVTYDSRGVPPSDLPPVVTMDDLVADAAALIERLDLGPCRVAGTSMGSRVTAELCLRRPELVDRAVLMAGFGRPSAFLAALNKAEAAHAELPVVRAALNLSPRTLADDRKARDWLDLFEMVDPDEKARGISRQDVGAGEDRLAAYARITVPTLVLAFADDLITPAVGGRDLAAAIPGARHREIPDAGHYGYLEQPEAVNAALLEFFA